MSMISTGISGLNAAQTGLNITGKNISNAGVDGHSREVVNFSSSDVSGVYVSSVERVSNEFAVQQARFNATQYGFATTAASHSARLETTMTGENSGMSSAINGFFGALNAASGDPMEPAYRSEVLSDSEALASRFNSLSTSLNTQAADINSQMSSLMDQANGLLDSLAKTNQAIAKASAGGTNTVSGTLLDQRDQSLQALSELMDVRVVVEGNNTATITTSTGEPLLLQGQKSELVSIAGYPDGSQSQIGVKTSANDTAKRIDNPGGGLGGLMEVRDNQLAESRRELDRLALVMADTMNSQMNEGFDLNGNPGTNLFTDINASFLMNERSNQVGGPESIDLKVAISDSGALTADNYLLSKNDNGELVVNRSPGGEEVPFETDSDGNIVFEGVTISASAAENSLADMANGSTYLIEPGKNAAGSMNVTISDPNALAFSGSATEPGSNSNLLAMVSAQDKPAVGGQTINQSWNNMATNVATSTARATSNLSASAQMFEEATSAVMSESGVNLDEEAGNLLMFQQLYSANAKVISTADAMFQTLLQAV